MFRRQSTSGAASGSVAGAFTTSSLAAVDAAIVPASSSALEAPSIPALLPAPVAICRHLSGPEWLEYILRTRTRSFGGIGPTQRVAYARQLFPYKAFPATKTLPALCSSEIVPPDGNTATSEAAFTEAEHRALDDYCEANARWIVDVTRKFIKATGCNGLATTAAGLSDACTALLKDDGLRRSVDRVRDYTLSCLISYPNVC